MNFFLNRNCVDISSATAILFVSLAVTIFSNPVFAKAMARASLKVSDYISYMEASQKTKTFTDDEKDLLYVSKFAFDAVSLGTFSVRAQSTGTISELAKSLSLVDIIQAFEQKIFTPEVWNIELDEEFNQIISKDKARFRRIFYFSDISWAWALKQIGEVQESRSVLEALFEKEYERVMALKNAVYGFRGTPLRTSESILRALNSMLDLKAQALQNEKMRKMKVHISKLPVSRIKT